VTWPNLNLFPFLLQPKQEKKHYIAENISLRKRVTEKYQGPVSQAVKLTAFYCIQLPSIFGDHNYVCLK
jgi:hypothetical protein